MSIVRIKLELKDIFPARCPECCNEARAGYDKAAEMPWCVGCVCGSYRALGRTLEGAVDGWNKWAEPIWRARRERWYKEHADDMEADQ